MIDINIPYVFKYCKHCDSWLVTSTVNFSRHKNGKYGLRSRCKKCEAEYKKQYRENNKEKIAEYAKQYYENNKEKKAEYNKQYYENNKEKIAEYRKQWRENNKEYNKQYYENNKEKKAVYCKQWRENNKEKIVEYAKQYDATPQGQVVAFNKNCRRRSREQNQGGGINKDQWLECMKYFGFKDAYTGEVLTKDNRSLDHIESISKGGEHEVWNLVPMDKDLNSSKKDKDMLEWYKQQDFFSEEKLQRIYDWQEYAYNKFYQLKESTN